MFPSRASGEREWEYVVLGESVTSGAPVCEVGVDPDPVLTALTAGGSRKGSAASIPPAQTNNCWLCGADCMVCAPPPHTHTHTPLVLLEKIGALLALLFLLFLFHGRRIETFILL